MENKELPAFANSHEVSGSSGLTKREYFAAMAMQGILAGRDTVADDPPMKWAVKLADEILEELDKNKS